MLCSHAGCEKPSRSRGWCVAHYTRWIRYGDPDTNKRPALGMHTAIERFDSKVARGPGCWEWLGTRTEGYGWFKFKNVVHKAHRFSYEYFNGEIPDGLLVRHTCDNRGCVNPDHLLVGTEADNARDMVERGRSLRGTRQRSAVLTEDEVREIRIMSSSGVSFRELVRRFGVKDSTVRAVVSGRTWTHVTDALPELAVKR